MANQPDRFSERLRRRALTRLLGHAPHENARPNTLSMLNHVARTATSGPSARNSLASNMFTFMPSRVTERELKPHVTDTVFSSKWLDNHHVVLGTVSHEIVKSNLYTGEYTDIPPIKGRQPAATREGIPAIDINPSKSLIAINGDDDKSIAIYRLPSFDPLFLGEGVHTEQIMDAKWITDEHCVTGCFNSILALWHVTHPQNLQAAVNNFMARGGPVPQFAPQPIYKIASKYVKTATDIHALTFNKAGQDMGILSSNGRVHIWDIPTFTQKQSVPLRYQNAVCMDYDPGRQYYAVGTQSHIEIVDRNLMPALCFRTPVNNPWILSISINKDIITIGTGIGMIYFYDITAGKYLTSDGGAICSLKTGAGFLLNPGGPGVPNPSNAVFTHCYDDTGSRLYTGGGPLSAPFRGSYTALWE